MFHGFIEAIPQHLTERLKRSPIRPDQPCICFRFANVPGRADALSIKVRLVIKTPRVVVTMRLLETRRQRPLRSRLQLGIRAFRCVIPAKTNPAGETHRLVVETRSLDIEVKLQVTFAPLRETGNGPN
ncbi:MAG: hypothetical protein MAG794_01195 [Gammaproteobacteria bacterium]|nr:hypothetical protein [Gammaproteobacteria bacterium]